jgi:phosphopentomutase
MKPFKRVFLIVADSAGIGEEPDAAKFGDVRDQYLGPRGPIGRRDQSPDDGKLRHRRTGRYPGREAHHESSARFCDAAPRSQQWQGYDDRTLGDDGHFDHQALPDLHRHRLPKSLIELEKETGHKIIGNYASSGTEILKVLGEEQMKENSLIVYTSADSVLQIAAHEEVTGKEELYRCCEIARKSA